MIAGPQVISEAYKRLKETLSGKEGESRTERRQQQLTPHVYQFGEFFLPCNWISQELCAEVEASKAKPENLAGFHHWAGSWKVIS